ncbi:MAG TPA: hypothetical protein VHF25_06610 [Nitriliruptorales bacterium]|nr:hypothetical protein [Nitriliruptorales bacterium]
MKAVAVGVAAAVGLGLVLSLFIRVSGGWFTLIASGFVGYGVARAVHWGAEGNRAGPFRGAAFGLAVGGVEVAWLLLGVLFPGGLGLLSYAAAAYGAWIVYR